MWILYFFGIKIYEALIHGAAFFHPKAKIWVEGRKDWRTTIQSTLPTKNTTSKTQRRIWVHCASLGEFEQGRPLLQEFRKEYPESLIILTFFSPSGYEIRKNTSLADLVFYLPLDGPKRSVDFINLIQPDLVFFIKYEFWYFYGKELAKKKIPFYCVSAIFRPGQIFFRPWGEFFRKILLRYTHLFVQDQQSLDILYRNRVARVTVSGDTRFDTVYDTIAKNVNLPEIKQFCGSSKIMVCGSTWPADNALLVPLINSGIEGMKFIIAPHEINAHQLAQLKGDLQKKSSYYSEWIKDMSMPVDVLIIDNVGMLSQLYSFGDFAYIGGGFGAGIHNILEASGFGLPVFFGPKHQKFLEAKELIALNAAFSVNTKEELDRILRSIMNQPSMIQKISETSKQYLNSRKGATNIVMNYLKINHN
ncbi:glycosyltransferase N-terminal domain-containing protein [soil metagenome]